MSVLVIAEHNNTELAAATLATITAGLELANEVDVLVLGYQCQSVADSAAKTQGVAAVMLADAEHLQHQLAEEIAPAIAALAGNYDYLLMAATTTGKNVLPRLAAQLDVQPINDIMAVIDGNTFKRPIYAGNVVATVVSHEPKKLLSVRATAFDKAAILESAGAEVKAIDPPAASGLSEFVSEELAKTDRPELTAANIVISGGRGLGNGDNFELIYGVADKLGAAVGASRAAVDAGFVPNDMQVGQTGKVVAPDLYVAVGISGAIQHLAGMKDSKVIVAINKDEDAPIFQVADYGLVADLFEVLPELNSKL